MRISDWSSDVCSSDLHTQVYRYVGFVRNPVVRPATKSGYSWPRSTSRKFPADPVDAHDPRCNFADVAIENVTPRHEREIPRSEEHTSELQSLMRISYAVFCWKKKTYTEHTRNKNTPNTQIQNPK